MYLTTYTFSVLQCTFPHEDVHSTGLCTSLLVQASACFALVQCKHAVYLAYTPSPNSVRAYTYRTPYYAFGVPRPEYAAVWQLCTSPHLQRTSTSCNVLVHRPCTSLHRHCLYLVQSTYAVYLTSTPSLYIVKSARTVHIVLCTSLTPVPLVYLVWIIHRGLVPLHTPSLGVPRAEYTHRVDHYTFAVPRAECTCHILYLAPRFLDAPRAGSAHMLCTSLLYTFSAHRAEYTYEPCSYAQALIRLVQNRTHTYQIVYLTTPSQSTSCSVHMPRTSLGASAFIVQSTHTACTSPLVHR